MSEIILKISYKNACIVEHALRTSLQARKSIYTNAQLMLLENKGIVDCKTLEQIIKEYEEEERALESFTREIDKEKERLGLIAK